MSLLFLLILLPHLNPIFRSHCLFLSRLLKFSEYFIQAYLTPTIYLSVFLDELANNTFPQNGFL